MTNTPDRKSRITWTHVCSLTITAWFGILAAGCVDPASLGDGSDTLGTFIDILIPSADPPDNNSPDNDPPDGDSPDTVPPEDQTSDDTNPDTDPPGDVETDTPPPDDTVTEETALPDNAYCNTVSDWPAANVAFEDEVLTLVNERRAIGADCGSGGSFDSAGPLTSAGDLRCAARNHSLDMAVRNFFSHTNPDGDGPGERLDEAGFSGFTWGENIAWGYGTPQQVVEGWMNSDGHCSNIMNPNFTEIGVGYHESDNWTQVFGAR